MFNTKATETCLLVTGLSQKKFVHLEPLRSYLHSFHRHKGCGSEKLFFIMYSVD